MEKIFPIIIIIEFFIAGIIYAYGGKVGQSIYWLSGGVLNIAVVFLIPIGK